jgi:hypothetical protein
MCGPDQAACGLVIESIPRYCPGMADSAPRPLTEEEQQEADRSPIQVVERFLALLCAKDIDGASDLLAEDVEYVNVGLPAVHGGDPAGIARRGNPRRTCEAAGRIGVAPTTVAGRPQSSASGDRDRLSCPR